MVLWTATRHFRMNTQKRYPFHCRGLECKSRKLRNTCNNRQIWPWSTKWSRAKANRLVITNTLFQQHKRRLYTWTLPDGQHQNQIDYILCTQRWKSSIQSARTSPGADCGSDHELIIAKFRLKLKRVGITTRPFRYDLSQIPYNYTVKVTNRFKGSDRQSAWRTKGRGSWHCIGGSDQDHPPKKEIQKTKWLSEEAL